ncbi:ferredoxin-dependent bilin reductase [Nitzschia inconspicua]|uniref:Ferredoxin-dependent bilin reductase n=1 Tax=Nitzschia inconspicua TaxID=303405 RepID=A0A9K3KKY1_9STRA|nr:ferredoxin-dependent bilin reductase [Nitzschia inconspicua]
MTSKYSSLVLCLLFITLRVPTSRAWSISVIPSFHQKFLRKSLVTLDTEGPFEFESTTIPVPSFLQEKWNKYRSQRRRKSNEKSSVSSLGQLPWIGDSMESKSNNNVFLSHWKWQLEFFQSQLTNLRVNSQDNSTCQNLMYIESDGTSNKGAAKKQRIYTLSLQSEEYRDIRMTYLQCGDQSQIFRCTCYPRNDMPILGMGLMQLGNHRNIAIIDFQPLLHDGDDETSLAEQSRYTRRLQDIRSSFKSMQHPMSDRHFDPNEQKYFTANPIIGKWIKDDDDALKNWQDLQQVHRDCVQAHVTLTQDRNGGRTDRNVHVQQLHSDYDTFVASKEPAGQLLSSAFGKDVAHRLVHQVIFPLSQQQQLL